MIQAQLVCYNWDPVERAGAKVTRKEAEHHFGKVWGEHSSTGWGLRRETMSDDEVAEFVTPMELRNCTLMYRKALDHDIAKKGKVAVRVTSDGILVPDEIGNVTFSRTGNTGATYYFNADKPITLPILRYTNGSTVIYCIDYRETQVIGNLWQGDTVCYTTDLHKTVNSITGIGYPLIGAGQNAHYAPLREYRAPLAMNQTVTGQATLTPESVAAALTRHSVTNIIGTAMARIGPNHQGDVMLCDGV